MKFYLFSFLLSLCLTAFAQVGINTETPRVTIDILPTKIDNTTAEGAILPNLTRAQLIAKEDAYLADYKGAIVYVTDLSGTITTKTAKVTAIGYYYFDGLAWQPFTGPAIEPWNKVGTTLPATNNTDNIYQKGKVVINGDTIARYTNAGDEAILTVTNGDAVINGLTVGRGSGQSLGGVAIGVQALPSNVSGASNIAIGFRSLYLNQIGSVNVAIGLNAMRNNYNGTNNIAIGSSTLALNTGGSFNTIIGEQAGNSNTTGKYNTAIGAYSGTYNSTGDSNTAIGYNALTSNEKSGNTAVGYSALSYNSTGENNVAVGMNSLRNLTTGTANTAIGVNSLPAAAQTSNHVAIGYNTLSVNSIGQSNIAIGSEALKTNTTGSHNIEVGWGNHNITSGSNNVMIGVSNVGLAGTLPVSLSNTVMVGYQSYAATNEGIAIGANARLSSTATNSIVIGANASSTTANTITLGNPTISYTMNVGTGSVAITSDRRIKKDIQNNVPGLDFIKKLNPVTYHFDYSALSAIQEIPDSIRNKKNEAEQEKVIRTGFIAQEVEKAAQEVGYNFDGVVTPKNDKDIYGLSYSTFVVPLVKAVQEQQIIIDKQQKQINELLKRLEALEQK